MKNKVTFEEAMQKLEEAVRKLESGNLPINEAMIEFEEAVSLVKYCNEVLCEAEQKVKLLLKGEDGSITDAPFVEENYEA